MMDKNILQQTVLDQRKIFEKKERLVKRELPETLIKSKKITVISGIRRSGKSTLLKEIAEKLDGYYYLNFEDERLLDFEYKDFNMLYEIFLSMHGEQKTIFFDEIQNIFGWEKFVRRLFEDGYKIFITGSNAKLLSSELATTLTGRHVKIELYPFSFKEYLQHKNFPLKKAYDTREKAKLDNLLDEFVKFGGFPEVAKSHDENELKQLYQDILIKDLIVRFKIKDTRDFRELSLYLMSNIGSKISFNNLKKILDFNSVTTVKNYVDLLESSYLDFLVSRFDYSLKKQLINDRKIYSIDTGLVNNISFAFSKNSGRLFENMIYVELRRRGKEIYYHGGKNECDFLVKEGRKIVEVLQVTENLNQENKEREIGGLLEAMEVHGLKTGLILTSNQEDEFIKNGKKVRVLPTWKWLLG